jgi:hypothetical protein
MYNQFEKRGAISNTGLLKVCDIPSGATSDGVARSSSRARICTRGLLDTDEGVLDTDGGLSDTDGGVLDTDRDLADTD